MAVKELSAEEIEAFIAADKIVRVGCRQPPLAPTEGKFVRSKEPVDGIWHYAFCPYKKGVTMPWLAAEEWLLEQEDADHARSMEEALAAMRRRQSGS